MANGFSQFFYTQQAQANNRQQSSLPEITLKLIALNQTPLTENSPYFIKIKNNILQIAKDYSAPNCQAFLTQLQQAIEQKHHNQALFAKLITEFTSLISESHLLKISEQNVPILKAMGINY